MNSVRHTDSITPLDYVFSRAIETVAPPNVIVLPFTVKIVQTEAELSKAVGIRTETYGRHHPELAAQLKAPEAADRADGSHVLLAACKETGEAVGTMRIETNTKSALAIETVLPEKSIDTGRTIAYATRLGVGRGQFAQRVKFGLFKALHRYCLARQIHWIVVGARALMDRQYLKLGFSDVYPCGRLAIIASSGSIPVRILALETMQVERLWGQERNTPIFALLLVRAREWMRLKPDPSLYSVRAVCGSRPRLLQHPTQARDRGPGSARNSPPPPPDLLETDRQCLRRHRRDC